MHEHDNFRLKFVLAIVVFVVSIFSSNSAAQSKSVNSQQGLILTISGNVQASGANLSGVTVILSGASSFTTTTDGGGNYSFTNLSAGSDYKVSIYKNSYSFNPANQLITNLQSDQTVNFTSGVPLCAPAPSNLVAWYAGNGNTNDLALANNGTLQGGATYAAGKVGQAFSLNGTNAYVQAASSSANDPTTAGSQQAWVYFNQTPSAAGRIMEIIGKGGIGTDFDLQAETDNKFRFFVRNGVVVASTTTIQTGVWYHVVGTWDSTGLRMYVNGVLENTNATANVARSVSNNPLQIGRQPVFTRLFNGLIDEAQIYNRALSAAEVQAIYNAGTAGVCSANSASTAAGSNVTANPVSNLSVTFASASQAGNTTADALTSTQIPALPDGIALYASAPIYDIRTSASYSGNVTVTENVAGVQNSTTCSNLRLYHFENGAWTSNTNGAPIYDSMTQACTLSQTVSSLSPFAVINLAPTAANVSVSGRVRSADGTGLRNAVVFLTDGSGLTRTARTGSFGFYRIDGIEAGQTVVIGVNSKLYQFETRVLFVGEDIADADFTPTNSREIRKAN